MRYALFFITICFHIRLMMPVCLSLFLQNTGKHTGTGKRQTGKILNPSARLAQFFGIKSLFERYPALSGGMKKFYP